MTTRLTIYAGGPVARALAATRDDEPEGNRSGRINDICASYMALMDSEIASIVLTRAQWCAIMDALNGAIIDQWSMPFVGAGIADATGLGDKWGIDQPALARAIGQLDRAATTALVEAAARFWSRADLGTDAALAAAGIVPVDARPAGV